MDFPERFSNLPEYAFPRLRNLLDAHPPGGEVLHMSIGEPRHPFPHWIAETLAQNIEGFGRYPPNDGLEELLAAIAKWYHRRFGLALDADTQVMTLNGSREGLFNAMLALSPESKQGKPPVALIPNPFYQVYAVGAAAAGARPVFVPATAETGFLPDYASLPAEVLDRASVAFICSPSNPQGAIAEEGYLADLIDLAERHDFTIFADECYSEIYQGAAPPSALAVAAARGADPERVVVFNSLSKRSNLPGLRSGFVASGPENVAQILRLRSYAGAPLPMPLQEVAARVWADEAHVVANRAAYAEKYDMAREILGDLPGAHIPRAGFFLWLQVEDGEKAALRLWREKGIRVLPGAYLARDTDTGNPGSKYIRVAMVAPKQETQRGLKDIRDCLWN